MKSPHIPVLINEVLKVINPNEEKTYVDATFGAGGYSRAFLNHETCCKVIGVDRDGSTERYAKDLRDEFKDRFLFIKGEFAAIDKLLQKEKINSVDAIVFDLGVSSMQLDIAERGFSFQKSGYLDMRMDNSQSKTAADIVNTLDNVSLANIIYQYGGEKKSRKIANAIVMARSDAEINDTKQLADIIKNAVGKYNDSIHPATRTFQALRIEVNDELKQLEMGLQAAAIMLATGGVLAVITFHSLEDRIVKNYFNQLTGKTIFSNRYFPELSVTKKKEKDFQLLFKRVIKPSAYEIKSNNRARSAKLRAIKRVR